MKNPIPHVKVRIIRKVDIGDFIRLYREAGWYESVYSKNPKIIMKVVKGSFCFAGAFLGKKMIGMGRGISDGLSDAYIQDVVVLKKYRNMGIGGRIVGEITKYLLSKRITWIGLIAMCGTENFYKKTGFRKMNDHTPMKFDAALFSKTQEDTD